MKKTSRNFARYQNFGKSFSLPLSSTRLLLGAPAIPFCSRPRSFPLSVRQSRLFNHSLSIIYPYVRKILNSAHLIFFLIFGLSGRFAALTLSGGIAGSHLRLVLNFPSKRQFLSLLIVIFAKRRSEYVEPDQAVKRDSEQTQRHQ